MNPGPVPTASAAGRVAAHVFEILRGGIDFAPVIRDRGETEHLDYTGGPGGAIAFPPAEVTLERGLLLVRIDVPDYQVSERIRPGALPVSITIHVPRERGDLLVHYGQAVAELITNVSTTLAGAPPIQVWHSRQAGAAASETPDYVIERIDHEFSFQNL